MLKKTILLIIAGFTFQFLISCDINCNPGPTIEMVYTDLRLDERARVDNQVNSIEDSVQKENFILFIDFEEQKKKLAHKGEPFKFGFRTAKALDCGPSYIYPDKVKELSILMINSEDMNDETDVTDFFVLKTESRTYNIEELIDRHSEEERGANFFNLSLLEYDSLYKMCTFRVTATLESGETFTKETEEIIFID